MTRRWMGHSGGPQCRATRMMLEALKGIGFKLDLHQDKEASRVALRQMLDW